jgi:DNA polymerase III epsilon subunit-like protein
MDQKRNENLKTTPSGRKRPVRHNRVGGIDPVTGNKRANSLVNPEVDPEEALDSLQRAGNAKESLYKMVGVDDGFFMERADLEDDTLLSKKDFKTLYSTIPANNPLVASFKASEADKEIITMYAEKRGLNIDPDEFDMIKKLCYNQITPGQLKRYIQMRGVDLNSRARSRQLSAEEMSGFVRAGFGNIWDVEELVRMGKKPHQLVVGNGKGGFELRPEWEEWHRTRGAVRFQRASFGEGRHQQPIDETEFLIVDLETTGLDLDASIIEIAMVRMRGDGTVIEEFQTLVDPGEKRTFMGETKDIYEKVAGTAHVHEIEPEYLEGAPSFESVSDKVKSMFEGAVIVAHYDKYEEGRFAYEFSRLNENLPVLPSLDTKKIAQEYYGLKKGKYKNGNKYDDSKLEAIHRKFTGKSMRNAHHAMADVKATQDFLKIILSDVKAGGVDTIGMFNPPPLGLSKGLDTPPIKLRPKKPRK